ncbi:hypothetical protein BHM03_00055449 [Ensete ventricosum]|nr:hypothetical protein BHM03_00055449 [Ensete ventricosum]
MHPPPCADTAYGSCVMASGLQMGVLYLALYLTALGTGGLKSSVSGLGSDQFDETNRGEKAQMMKFFSWFFFFISLGSLLAVTVLVYIQDNLGRRWGYGLCALSVVVGLVVFLTGTRRYRFKKLAGSPLTQIAAVVVAAWKKRGLELPSDPSLLHDIDANAAAAAAAAADAEKGSRKSKAKQRLPHTKQFRYARVAMAKLPTKGTCHPINKWPFPASQCLIVFFLPCSFLDRAAINVNPGEEKRSKWELCTLTDVEEVKTVIRMLPIWATTIMFWTVYAQMTTFSVSQATTMNRHIGRSFEIPSGSLTVFFVGSILITVPIYDRFIVPVAKRLTGNPHGFTPLQRIGFGLGLSVLAMASAALAEMKRLRVARSDPAALEMGATVPLSVFWLIPQFFLVGAGEAFTYIGQLDFFLRECPKGMKTMSTGLFLSTLSLGFFVSTALVAAVDSITGQSGHGAWLAENLNRGKLNNFYWLLAALCLVNLMFYLVAAKWYVYKDQRPAVDDDSVALEELTEEACYQA